MQIRDRIVLITGASEGIGAACAHAFAARGARVVLTARSSDRLERVAAACGAEALVVPGDLLDDEHRRHVVAHAVERFGSVDILLNNAGVGLYAPSWQASLEQARALFDLNVFAALAMIQLVVPVMRGKKRGTIVNVSSIAGKVTLPWFTLYSASKYALGSLTDGLRIELTADGIHVMVVCPGYVKTEFQQHVLAGRPPEAVARSRRFAITAGQCAEAIVRGVERNARTVVTPRAGWLLIGLARLLPNFLDRRLARIYGDGNTGKGTSP